MPGDAALLEHAQDRIDALNKTYERRLPSILFHRPRRWNNTERVWMGYERKRGKLADLNWLLRGARPASVSERFSLIGRRRCRTGGHPLRDHARHRHGIAARRSATVRRHDGAPAEPPAVRRDAGPGARGLRNPAAAGEPEPAGHQPLSLCAAAQRRARASIPTRERCPTYTRTCSTKARSLARAFTTSTRSSSRSSDKFPENRILSHDLLEGCYARSGLLSDVELFEDYPPTYAADAARRHRWIRGDWQIASWLLPRVPGVAGQSVPQSAVRACRDGKSPTTCGAASCRSRSCCYCWRAGSRCRPRLAWTLVVLGIVLLPPLLNSLLTAGAEAARGSRYGSIWRQPRSRRQRNAPRRDSTLACLPHEAWFSADAILRTTWRIAGLASPAARMESVRRAGAQRRARAAGVRAVDVDCAGDQHSRRARTWPLRGRRCCCLPRRSCCSG